ncbi:P-loop containing nucleoside triphosphate hydrolase protein [Gonapodya prolifera JEL478]|uniref:RNA helicase n=1 Tax=Gonapodya prolifera (strain JEL478) TaxID=1344416 RepID=A0A139A144_GONPJ|nr:P-loop containing nucleoside triphosphate hydrolase protein [Gonapodya prolifera JEL478]|eukprot:KXS10462.1 P-loop containing nucleoside triphosphate hydrolase protein [Gonapodya prolifera JEL478]
MPPKKNKPGSAAPTSSSSAAASKQGSSSSRPSSAPLTPQQEREARQAAAQEQKKALFGNWTGKTPLSLLHEHCQRQGWNKPGFHSMRLHSGFQTNVTLSKEGQTVRIVPEGFFYKTDAESKHFAATYALHRVASARNLGTLLPPDHKSLWAQLNQMKQQLEQQNGREWVEFQYAADPFAAQVARERKREDDRKAKEKAVKERKEKERKVRASYPALHLNQELRKAVEDLIKRTGLSVEQLQPQEETVEENESDSDDSDSDTDAIAVAAHVASSSRASAPLNPARGSASTPPPKPSTPTPKAPTSRTSPLISSLSALGFHPSHVREALSHLPTPDQSTVLDWLLLHVPEEDLPARFMDKRYRTGLSASNLSPEELAVEYKVERLRKLGFSISAIRTALARNPSELTTLQQLVAELRPYNDTTEPDTSLTNDSAAEQESFLDRLEELTTLRAIFGDDFVYPAYADQIVFPSQSSMADEEPTETSIPITSISILLPSALPKNPSPPVLTLYFPPGSLYPRTPCVPIVSCDQVPAYVRLHLAAKLRQMARDMAGRSEVAGFEMAGWVERELEGVVKEPPLLVPQRSGNRNPSNGASRLDDGLTGSGDSASAEVALQNQKVQPPKSNTDFGGGKREQTKQKNGVSDDSRGNRNSGKDSAFAEDSSTTLPSKPASTNPLFREREAQRQKLPVWPHRSSVVNALQESKVVVVCGETGCGKSTQVPQFILDDVVQGNLGVVVTQPRRISAISLAERVAWERGEKVGDSVGYSIRGESVRSAKTRLTFVTTGVLLRRLQDAAGKGSLKGVGCIVVDEVHERGIDSDFLLIILRDILAQNPGLRVVLMSATVDSETFSQYFGGAPVLNIPGFTFPVKELFVNDVRRAIRGTNFPGANSWQELNDDDENAQEAQNRKKSKQDNRDEDQIDYQVVADLVRWISDEGDAIASVQDGTTDSTNRSVPPRMQDGVLGAVLIFMPGVAEIKRCIDAIRSTFNGAGMSSRFEILPLHANLSSQEQMSVFKPMKRGVRRIVVSTNVAETSVTIDGVIHVIDTGRVKETNFDPQTRMQSLVETWCSQASAKQRKGRAGRTRPGVCYKLYSARVASQTMIPFTVPEIVRTPLEQLCLAVKAMSIPSPADFLSKAPTPPSTEAINSALRVLFEVSAMDEKTGELTALGKHMANIPVDLRIAKILIIGAAFNCVESVAGIAACLSGKNPFVSPLDKRAEAEMARSRFATEKSDLLTVLKAFEEWSNLRKGGRGQEREFCEKNFLSRVSLLTAADLKDQFLEHLLDLGFIEKSYFSDTNNFSKMNTNSKNWRVVKSVIVAGLYPQILKIRHPETIYTQTLSGAFAQDPKPNQFRFFSRDQGRVFLHPSSINFGQFKYETDAFACYNSLVNTSKVFARDVTVVSSGWSILLFGGHIGVDHGAGLVRVNGWIVMRSFARIGVLANGLRKALDRVLAEKIEDPTRDIHENDAVRLIVNILANDGS